MRKESTVCVHGDAKINKTEDISVNNGATVPLSMFIIHTFFHLKLVQEVPLKVFISSYNSMMYMKNFTNEIYRFFVRVLIDSIINHSL
jgi:hypothetical protein